MTSLSQHLLPALAEGLTGATPVTVPSYDRSQLRAGIVHFGVGGFHRAHQAMYLDTLMNQGKALDWAICGVGVLPGDRHMLDVMEAQDHLYTLVIKHPDGRREARLFDTAYRSLTARPCARISEPKRARANSCPAGRGWAMMEASRAPRRAETLSP